MPPSLLTRRRFTLAASVAVLGGCAAGRPADSAAPVITGRAHYRARILLPASAVFEATLEDVSRAGAPAEVVARVQVTNLQPPPFRFALPYDPARIVPGRRYVVRGRITLDQVLRFTTTTAYPVLGEGQVKHVELQLEGQSGVYRPLPGT